MLAQSCIRSALLPCLLCLLCSGCGESRESLFRRELVGTWRGDYETVILHITFQADGTYTQSADAKGAMALVTGFNKLIGGNEFHGTWTVQDNLLIMEQQGNSNAAVDAFQKLIIATDMASGGDLGTNKPLTVEIEDARNGLLIFKSGATMEKVRGD
jgi:hypothetical protein